MVIKDVACQRSQWLHFSRFSSSLLSLLRAQFSDPYKIVGKTKVLYFFKIVSVLTFLKIVLLIVSNNCKNFANLDSTSLEKKVNWLTCSGYKTDDYISRELQITRILGKIDEYRRNWFQHLQRMPQKRIPLKSYYYRPQGRRTIGRPKKRWREQLYS